MVPHGPVAVVAELRYRGCAVLVAGDECQGLSQVKQREGHDHSIRLAQLYRVLPGLRGQVEDVDGFRRQGVGHCD
jgi:hypothetical protein